MCIFFLIGSLVNKCLQIIFKREFAWGKNRSIGIPQNIYTLFFFEYLKILQTAVNASMIEGIYQSRVFESSQFNTLTGYLV